MRSLIDRYLLLTFDIDAHPFTFFQGSVLKSWPSRCLVSQAHDVCKGVGHIAPMTKLERWLTDAPTIFFMMKMVDEVLVSVS